jgi:hypothetical protein
MRRGRVSSAARVHHPGRILATSHRGAGGAKVAHGELSPAWELGIEQRAKSVDQGSVELIPGEDVFKEIEAELQARRGRR